MLQIEQAHAATARGKPRHTFFESTREHVGGHGNPHSLDLPEYVGCVHRSRAHLLEQVRLRMRMPLRS